MVDIDRNSDKPLTEWLLNVSCFAESQAELELAYRDIFGLPPGFSRRMSGRVWMITEGDAPIPADNKVPMTIPVEEQGTSGSNRSSSSKDDLEDLDDEELIRKVKELQG